ncbi:hypothetical protein OG21DRAFT_501779 [Imleria badia]|nr:hypothetical protein OG21DRAFT_501779 [Imleria badia]
MNSHSRRRDDRSAPADPLKQWVPADKYPLDYDADRRRNRSATIPAHSYDPRSHPSHDVRYNDPRQSSRAQRQDPHYPPAASYSYQHSSAHPPSTSKAYQHATRPSAQHPSSGHHYPQPSSYQPSHPTPAYPVASSSRRPHQDAAPDPRPSRRPPPSTHQPAYDYLSSGEEMPRPSARPSRAVPASMQPSSSVPSNQAFWNPPPEISSSRRHQERDRDRDRDRDRERDREREKPTAELENK